MTTTTRRTLPRGQPAPTFLSSGTPARPRRVLVATDGSTASAAALRFARAMQVRGDWEPDALTVLEPIPVSMAEVAFAVPSDEYVQQVRDGLVARIAKQVRRYGSAAWKLDALFGPPASTIVDVARERDAEMLVLGLGRHGKLARLFGAETAARVARTAAVPVLAVNASPRLKMRTAVVAVDFGSSSLRAVREALALLEPPARLHLLHVRWAFEGRTMRPDDWERTYAQGVELEFARLIESLGRHPGMRVTSEMKLGNVVETILAVAKRLDADLIAVGSHNRTTLDRLLIGSTPAHLLRGATSSVLISPPADDS